MSSTGSQPDLQSGAAAANHDQPQLHIGIGNAQVVVSLGIGNHGSDSSDSSLSSSSTDDSMSGNDVAKEILAKINSASHITPVQKPVAVDVVENKSSESTKETQPISGQAPEPAVTKDTNHIGGNVNRFLAQLETESSDSSLSSSSDSSSIDDVRENVPLVQSSGAQPVRDLKDIMRSANKLIDMDDSSSTAVDDEEIMLTLRRNASEKKPVLPPREDNDHLGEAPIPADEQHEVLPEVAPPAEEVVDSAATTILKRLDEEGLLDSPIEDGVAEYAPSPIEPKEGHHSSDADVLVHGSESRSTDDDSSLLTSSTSDSTLSSIASTTYEDDIDDLDVSQDDDGMIRRPRVEDSSLAELVAQAPSTTSETYSEEDDGDDGIDVLESHRVRKLYDLIRNLAMDRNPWPAMCDVVGIPRLNATPAELPEMADEIERARKEIADLQALCRRLEMKVEEKRRAVEGRKRENEISMDTSTTNVFSQLLEMTAQTDKKYPGVVSSIVTPSASGSRGSPSRSRGAGVVPSPAPRRKAVQPAQSEDILRYPVQAQIANLRLRNEEMRMVINEGLPLRSIVREGVKTSRRVTEARDRTVMLQERLQRVISQNTRYSAILDRTNKQAKLSQERMLEAQMEAQKLAVQRNMLDKRLREERSILMPDSSSNEAIRASPAMRRQSGSPRRIRTIPALLSTVRQLEEQRAVLTRKLVALDQAHREKIAVDEESSHVSDSSLLSECTFEEDKAKTIMELNALSAELEKAVQTRTAHGGGKKDDHLYTQEEEFFEPSTIFPSSDDKRELTPDPSGEYSLTTHTIDSD